MGRRAAARVWLQVPRAQSLDRSAGAAGDLGVFTLQNSLSALYGQFVLQDRPRCNARVLVLVQELAIKLPMSLQLYANEQGGVLRCS